MKNLVFLFVVLLLLSCSSENGTKPELTNPEMQVENSGEITQRERTWDLVVVDDDNWFLNLNYNLTYNSCALYVGELTYTIYSVTYTGPASAIYSPGIDIFSVSCDDPRPSGGGDLNYAFKFDNDDMEGHYFYFSPNNHYGSTIGAEIVSGSIGPHTPAPNAVINYNLEAKSKTSLPNTE